MTFFSFLDCSTPVKCIKPVQEWPCSLYVCLHVSACLLTSTVCVDEEGNCRTGKPLVPKYPLFSIFPLNFFFFFLDRWLSKDLFYVGLWPSHGVFSKPEKQVSSLTSPTPQCDSELFVVERRDGI